MKDETIFEDPKSNKAWASADAIRKKHGCQPYVRQAFDT
jgi:integrase